MKNRWQECRVCGAEPFDDAYVWGLDGGLVCQGCSRLIRHQAQALFGIEATGSTYGVEFTWKDMHALLVSLRSDLNMMTRSRTFTLTDEAMRRTEVPVG